MIETIKKFFGAGPKIDFADLVKKGGIVLDVRSKGEYAGGHIRGSINIPLDQLENNLNKFKDKQKAVITCCASGARSSMAKSILKGRGYSNVHNGGSWMSLEQRIM